jgi:hypothetical protein
MTDITPPPELVQQWIGDYYGCPVSGELAGVETAIATRAAQWGADQELEACVEWIHDWDGPGGSSEVALVVANLRTARRPKPPSLNKFCPALEQALAILDDAHRGDLGDNEMAIIRRALEQLDD